MDVETVSFMLTRVETLLTEAFRLDMMGNGEQANVMGDRAFAIAEEWEFHPDLMGHLCESAPEWARRIVSDSFSE